MGNASQQRKHPHLSVVEDTVSEPRPKYFNEIAAGTLIDRFYIYSQPDFAIGAQFYEQSRAYDKSGESAFPDFSERNLIELGSEFTKEQIEAALLNRDEDENMRITRLRALIVERVEESQLFFDATRDLEEAERNGFTIDQCSPGLLVYEP